MVTIILFFLTRHIGRLALRKGLRPFQWKLFTVGAWFGAEFIGLLLIIPIFKLNITDLRAILSGVNVQDPSTLFLIGLMGLMSAFGGYLIVRAILEKKQDFMDNDINHISAEDRSPPQNK